MPDEEEEPRRKKRGKGLSKRKISAIILILLILSLGAVFQHYCVEPLLGEGAAQQYAECLAQKQVLDERFVECANSNKACEFQLQQCLGT